MTATHTADEAIGRFALIRGAGSLDTDEACVMTAISWMAGEAWTASPKCAHPLLAQLAIRGNDAPDTTPDQRADLLRAGATGLMDTWWIPAEVIVGAIARPEGVEPESPIGLALRVAESMSSWKATKRRANLGGAYLGGADLGGADLRGARNVVLPDGWEIDETNGVARRSHEVQS